MPLPQPASACYAPPMFRTLALLALALSPAAQAQNAPEVSEVDAIACRLSVPDYTGFALSLDDVAKARHWKQIPSANAFLSEYELPADILVAGSHRTRRIAFSANAILAILDVADPAEIARGENIENQMDPAPLIAELAGPDGKHRAEAEAAVKFRKFLGERILKDETEPADGEAFRMHMTVARSISNVTSHPGKTLYGCSYRMEMLDKDGKPL